MISSNKKLRVIRCDESELSERYTNGSIISYKYPITDGYIYVCIDSGNVYVDDCSQTDNNGNIIANRILINGNSSSNLYDALSSITNGNTTEINEYITTLQNNIDNTESKFIDLLTELHLLGDNITKTGNGTITIIGSEVFTEVEKTETYAKLTINDGAESLSEENGKLSVPLGKDKIYGIPVNNGKYISRYLNSELYNQAESEGSSYGKYISFEEHLGTFKYHFNYNSVFASGDLNDSNEFDRIPKLELTSGSSDFISNNDLYIRPKTTNGVTLNDIGLKIHVEGFSNITKQGADIIISFYRFNNTDLDNTATESYRNNNYTCTFRVNAIFYETDDTRLNYSAGSGINITTQNNNSLDKVINLSSDGIKRNGTGVASDASDASFGPSSNVTGSNGNTITVPYITVDKFGRVTNITNKTYTSVDTTYNTATENADGLMSAADKKKLNGIAAEANKYVHPKQTARDKNLYKVKVDDTGHITDVTAVGNASTTADGLMSAADKQKLENSMYSLYSYQDTSYKHPYWFNFDFELTEDDSTTYYDTRRIAVLDLSSNDKWKYITIYASFPSEGIGQCFNMYIPTENLKITETVIRMINLTNQAETSSLSIAEAYVKCICNIEDGKKKLHILARNSTYWRWNSDITQNPTVYTGQSWKAAYGNEACLGIKRIFVSY